MKKMPRGPQLTEVTGKRAPDSSGGFGQEVGVGLQSGAAFGGWKRLITGQRAANATQKCETASPGRGTEGLTRAPVCAFCKRMG